MDLQPPVVQNLVHTDQICSNGHWNLSILLCHSLPSCQTASRLSGVWAESWAASSLQATSPPLDLKHIHLYSFNVSTTIVRESFGRSFNEDESSLCSHLYGELLDLVAFHGIYNLPPCGSCLSFYIIPF